MRYYAKVNTAHPRIGMLTTGEYLTEQQAEALGREKLKDLVERGVLAEDAGRPAEPEKAAGAAQTETEEAKTGLPTEPPEEDESEELPTLDAEEVLAEKPEKTAKADAKSGGRRKTR